MYYIIPILAVAGLIGIDQFTKYLCVQNMSLGQEIPLIDGVFSLQYVENRGAAFGIFQGARWIFIILTIAVIGAIVYYYVKMPKTKVNGYVRLSLVLITAGAVGNAIDRAMQGYVVDFFYFKLIDFAVFNVADSLLVCGTFLLAFLMFFFVKDEKVKP